MPQEQRMSDDDSSESSSYVQRKIEPLLQMLLTEVLAEQPDNPAAFMVQKLQEALGIPESASKQGKYQQQLGRSCRRTSTTVRSRYKILAYQVLDGNEEEQHLSDASRYTAVKTRSVKRLSTVTADACEEIISDIDSTEDTSDDSASSDYGDLPDVLAGDFPRNWNPGPRQAILAPSSSLSSKSTGSFVSIASWNSYTKIPSEIKEQLREAFKTCLLFRHLTHSEIDSLLSHFTKKKYPTGTRLQNINTLVLIERGEIDVVVRTPKLLNRVLHSSNTSPAALPFSSIGTPLATPLAGSTGCHPAESIQRLLRKGFPGGQRSSGGRHLLLEQYSSYNTKDKEPTSPFTDNGCSPSDIDTEIYLTPSLRHKASGCYEVSQEPAVSFEEVKQSSFDLALLTATSALDSGGECLDDYVLTADAKKATNPAEGSNAAEGGGSSAASDLNNHLLRQESELFGGTAELLKSDIEVYPSDLSLTVNNSERICDSGAQYSEAYRIQRNTAEEEPIVADGLNLPRLPMRPTTDISFGRSLTDQLSLRLPLKAAQTVGASPIAAAASPVAAAASVTLTKLVGLGRSMRQFSLGIDPADRFAQYSRSGQFSACVRDRSKTTDSRHLKNRKQELTPSPSRGRHSPADPSPTEISPGGEHKTLRGSCTTSSQCATSTVELTLPKSSEDFEIRAETAEAVVRSSKSPATVNIIENAVRSENKRGFSLQKGAAWLMRQWSNSAGFARSSKSQENASLTRPRTSGSPEESATSASGLVHLASVRLKKAVETSHHCSLDPQEISFSPRHKIYKGFRRESKTCRPPDSDSDTSGSSFPPQGVEVFQLLDNDAQEKSDKDPVRSLSRFHVPLASPKGTDIAISADGASQDTVLQKFSKGSILGLMELLLFPLGVKAAGTSQSSKKLSFLSSSAAEILPPAAATGSYLGSFTNTVAERALPQAPEINSTEHLAYDARYNSANSPSTPGAEPISDPFCHNFDNTTVTVNDQEILDDIAASIDYVVRSDVVCWVMKTSELRRVLSRLAETRANAIAGCLAATPFFSKLSLTRLRDIADIALEDFYADTEIIAEQGTSCRYFYIIFSGSVKETRRYGAIDCNVINVRVLKSQEWFGDEAFLASENGGVHRSTYVASAASLKDFVKILKIPVHALTRMLGPIEELLR